MRKLFALLFLAVLLIGVVSAYDTSIDNYKVVSPDAKTITIMDKGFLSIGKDTELATFELKTNHLEQIGLGYQKGAEFTIKNTYEAVNEMIKGMEFYNVRQGMKPIIVDYDLKYLSTEQYDKPIYKEVCDKIINGLPSCHAEQIGTEKATRNVWLDYTPKTMIKGEEITLSIWITAKQGDYIEWIPEMKYGKIEEWASWSASLNVELYSYYKLDEPSGTILDSLNRINLTNNNAGYGATGIINNAIDFEASDGSDYLSQNTNQTYWNKDKDMTINLWVKPESTANGRHYLAIGGGPAPSLQLTLKTDGSDKFDVGFLETDTAWRGSVQSTNTVGTGNWKMLSVRYYTNKTFDIFINATFQGRAVHTSTQTSGVELHVGTGIASTGGSSGEVYDGIIDEIGIWNRTLTTAEITQLYNDGTGITYPNSPTVTLNTPVDTYNSTSLSNTFNCSISTVAPTNVTFYINNTAIATNTSGLLGNYIFTNTTTEGSHTWNCGACGADGVCANGTARTFNVALPTPTATITYPTAYQNFTTDEIDLNCTATDSVGINNVTMFKYFWNTTEYYYFIEQNTSQVNGSYYFHESDSYNGDFNVTCQACNIIGKCTNSSTTYITIDTVAPTIESKINIDPIMNIGDNQTLSYNITDIYVWFHNAWVDGGSFRFSHLDKCWYSYCGVNTTFECIDSPATGTLNITTVAPCHEASPYEVITVYANDTFGWVNQDGANNRWLFDATPPTLNITAPIGIIDYQEINTNLNLTWTVNDTNLDDCWYNYEGVNTTVTCGDGYKEINITNYSARTITMFANDTIGNIVSDNTSWNYKAFLNSVSYPKTAIGGSIELFSVGIISQSNTIAAVYLDFNGTTSLMQYIAGVYSINKAMPPFATAENITWNYRIIFGDSSELNLSYVTEISPFSLDDCSAFTYPLYNITIVDEENLENISGTVELTIDFYSSDRSSLASTYNGSFSYDGINPIQICIQNISGDYSVDYQMRFYSNESLYFVKYKMAQNSTLNTGTLGQKIILYDLLYSSGNIFQVIVRGVPGGNTGILVDIQRQYLTTDNFISTESYVTDDGGEAVAHLTQASAIYNFLLSKNGKLIGTFNNYQVKCNNYATGDCSVRLDLSTATTDTPDYSTNGNITGVYLLDKGNRTLYFTYTTTDSQVHTITQQVISNEGFGNNTIYNDSSFGLSGTMVGTIPISLGNITFYSIINVDGKYAGTKIFSLAPAPPNMYGIDVLIELLLFSTLALLFIGNPITIVIGAMLGMLMSFSLVMLNGAELFNILAIMGYFVAAGAIIIWKMSKSFGSAS